MCSLFNASAMEDDEEYLPENLHKYSYRYLQQIAKGLGLPSNVKKVCMIQLIHAKKYSSHEHVENLVREIRQQRQHSASNRKKLKNRMKYAQQSAEISSTSNSKSPLSDARKSKSNHIIVRYSAEPYSPLTKVNNNIPHTTTSKNLSDRVLRSFRGIRKPSYIVDNALGVIKTSGTEENVKTAEKMRICKEDKCLQVDYESLMRRTTGWTNKGILPTQGMKSVIKPPQPLKRQRRLSGIYPLNEETTTLKKVNVSVRRADGTLAKLNAFIPKPLRQNEKGNTGFVDKSSNTSNIIENYRGINMFSENFVNRDNPTDIVNMSSFKENRNQYKVYYHKKIRVEQTTSIRSKDSAMCASNQCRLPKINDVFSKFNSCNKKDVTKPIYVQVQNEPNTVPNAPIIHQDLNGYQTSMLENIYNLKNMFIVNNSLLQAYTTKAKTKCVYSTPVIATAKAQPSTTMSGLYNNASSQANQTYTSMDGPEQDFGNYSHTDTDMAVQPPGSPTSTQSQNLDLDVTIPEEMVEDAFEVISQDGDYMERMGMDVKMQCVLCNWAGPKIMLEYHIRTEHVTDIADAECSEWRMTYTLGSLVKGTEWCNKVLDKAARLFVLSAKYEDPDCIQVTLSTLSSEYDSPTTGCITMYNNVTGEPFVWKGLIQQLPPTLSFSDSNCLKLELSKLNVLPNSANLKLLNRELVVRSPTKVVVGQPELDSIYITVFVKWDN